MTAAITTPAQIIKTFAELLAIREYVLQHLLRLPQLRLPQLRLPQLRLPQLRLPQLRL
jgi:hypothetical protein